MMSFPSRVLRRTQGIARRALARRKTPWAALFALACVTVMAVVVPPPPAAANPVPSAPAEPALPAGGLQPLSGASAGAPGGLRVSSPFAVPTTSITSSVSPHTIPSPHLLSPGTRLFTPPPQPGAVRQIVHLLLSGHLHEAVLLAEMVLTPQAVWLTGGTPHQVARQVRATLAEAHASRTEPVFVAYDIPGRDCAQYSAGGATNGSAYAAWIAAIAAAIGHQRAVVLLEPDGLANLPSDCAVYGTPAYPFTDAERIAEIHDAAVTLEHDPHVAVYLDAGNSAWQNVGTMAERLVEAGVTETQGFFLNVSNYQYTVNSIDYGRWISDCIAYATVVSPGAYGNCPGQYWNGGPPGTEIAHLLGPWTGVALNRYGIWSATTTVADLNISGINQIYQNLLGPVVPTTHYVIDTSRNGTGPNDMETYANPPYDQPSSVITTLQNGNWCNSPGAGLGLRPTTTTGVPLVDAYLWVKTPGESDGQCDAAGGVRAWDYSVFSEPGWPTTGAAQALFDPLWGRVDPPAGKWFDAQALQLAEDANPPLPSFPSFAASGVATR